MKQLTILLTLSFFILSVSAQQATSTTTKQATPVMKVDSKPAASSNVPVSNHDESKACCKGETAAECKHDSKSCSKESAGSAACCQKSGDAKSCSHESKQACSHDGKSCSHGATEKKAE